MKLALRSIDTQINDSQQTQLFAMTADSVVGSIVINVDRKPFLKIERLFVVERARRCGVARELMLEAERLAIEGGCTNAILTISPADIGSDVQAVYESLGYELTYIHNCRAGEMHKRLEAS